jgi:transcriptional regulator with XRE-family HTH domain
VVEPDASEPRASTGLEALDAVLGGLYWGDNVVWALDGAPAEPFYRAIANAGGGFDSKLAITLGRSIDRYAATGLAVIDAGPRSELAQPADLLREIGRLCQSRGRRLLLFDTLDTMAHAWGANAAREFFARCCPLLLEVGAVAYWAMRARKTPEPVRDTVQAVTQCVLHVDERSVRVAKAEGRDDAVRGTVLHWHQEHGQVVIAPAELAFRVAASLRAVRRSRHLSQHDLGALAGVTASAISQVERAERGLSLASLVRLSSALGVTIDDLLRGEEPVPYRIGRRPDDHSIALLDGPNSDLRIDLVHLGPRESGSPPDLRPGTGIVAVASGLVQIEIEGQTPAIRHGEVLVADSEKVAAWRNLGQTEAVLFWIVAQPARAAQFRRWG